jgi:hypothetical protein
MANGSNGRSPNGRSPNGRPAGPPNGRSPNGRPTQPPKKAPPKKAPLKPKATRPAGWTPIRQYWTISMGPGQPPLRVPLPPGGSGANPFQVPEISAADRAIQSQGFADDFDKQMKSAQRGGRLGSLVRGLSPAAMTLLRLGPIGLLLSIPSSERQEKPGASGAAKSKPLDEYFDPMSGS